MQEHNEWYALVLEELKRLDRDIREERQRSYEKFIRLEECVDEIEETAKAAMESKHEFNAQIRREIDRACIETRQAEEDVRADIKKLDRKLDNEVLHIKVNGSTGLRNILEDLYRLTLEQRAKSQIGQAVSNLTQVYPVLRFFKSKFGKGLLALFATFAVLSMIHSVFPAVDPIGLIGDLIKLIFKVQ